MLDKSFCIPAGLIAESALLASHMYTAIYVTETRTLRAQLEHSWGMRLLWLTYSYKWEVAYLVSLICHDYLNISNYFGCNDHTLQL